jgi:hypothetical protein
MIGDWGMVKLGAAAACLLAAGGTARPDDNPAKKPPRLEFRVLANKKDDAPAFDAAAKMLTDPQRQDDLRKRAETGKPPPALEAAADKGPSYAWVQVGPAMLREKGGDFAKAAAEARDAKGPVAWVGGSLLYGRLCRDANFSKEERDAKKYDYFLLSRLPEKGKAVTGEFVVEAKSGKDARDRPCIDLVLGREGAELIGQLTSKNLDHPLVVLIDGRAAAAPVIRAAVGARARLTGDFTPKEIDALVEGLGRGLPMKDK